MFFQRVSSSQILSLKCRMCSVATKIYHKRENKTLCKNVIVNKCMAMSNSGVAASNRNMLNLQLCVDAGTLQISQTQGKLSNQTRMNLTTVALKSCMNAQNLASKRSVLHLMNVQRTGSGSHVLTAGLISVKEWVCILLFEYVFFTQYSIRIAY